MKKASLTVAVVSIMLLQTHMSFAQDKIQNTKNSQTTDKVVDLGTTTIVGKSKEAVRKNVGSAHRVSAEDMADFVATDAHDVLSQVPGVYSRGEDGYGLRPNIALRGVRAERSQNVTIMEDGILITPAPYSAPAAYYFPNMARMKAVEVFKGPAAIKYGPRTVGGAINMLSQPTSSQGSEGKVSLTYGLNNEYKAYGKYSDAVTDTFGYTIGGLFYGADGFQKIDESDKSTGFQRRDINLKLGWYPEAIEDPNADDDSEPTEHILIAKIGYADERSNATYLGLSDADFANDPKRRYIASKNDNFKSKHAQVHLQHFMYLPNDLTLESKAYYNYFERDWHKLDGFANTKDALFGGAKIAEVLKDPNASRANQVMYGLLTGETNTKDLDVPYLNLGLDVTNNARKYHATGLDVQGKKTFDTAWGDKNISHELEAGLRYHHDRIERNHVTKGYAVDDKNLTFNGFSGDKLINRGESNALAAFLLDTLSYEKWRISLGLRAESIDSKLTEKTLNFAQNSSDNSNKETAVLPGAGFYYQAFPEWGILAGVHSGFSPAGPGRAGSTADVETSTNYEFGVRYASNKASINTELIGFFSDYDNVIGRARTSNAASQAGDSFNSGAVNIYGAELAVDAEFTHKFYTFPIKLAYTYTDSEFQTSFDSSFKEWGNVSKGDELPYVPKHKARLQLGAELLDTWKANVAINFTGKMREKAGSGDYKKGENTKNTTLVDVSGKYMIDDKFSVNAKLQNAFDNQNIASRRPFGARPVKPRTILVGMDYEF